MGKQRRCRSLVEAAEWEVGHETRQRCGAEPFRQWQYQAWRQRTIGVGDAQMDDNVRGHGEDSPTNGPTELYKSHRVVGMGAPEIIRSPKRGS
jgi:hypothetical protein